MKPKDSTAFAMELDESIRPQDDFFGYVNNTWLAGHPIPDSETRWGAFTILRDEAWKNMDTIYKGLAANDTPLGTIEQQARDLYYTGMHFDSLEAEHLATIAARLQHIDAVSDLSALCHVLGGLETIGVTGLWHSEVDADNKDSKRHIMRLSQPNLTLPDRDYYLSDTQKMKDVRQAYEAHVKEVYSYFPVLAESAETLWQALWHIELDLATQSRTNVELRDVEKNYNRMSYAALVQDYPTIDWTAYASALGWKTGDDISVSQPEFLAFINTQLSVRSLQDWKVYLKWRLVMAYYAHISARFADLKFEFFGKVLSGATEIMPLWKRVVVHIDRALGEGVGRLYAAQHFPEAAKQQMRMMVEEVRDAYAKRIAGNDWMSDATKQSALKKLANIKVLIGYPDEWRDYTDLKVGRRSHVDNLMAAAQFDAAYYLDKLSKPTSRDDWFMYPQTVNAYHDPYRLVICFPAAILQKPFFDPAAPVAVNMGGIGTVIGHELTHGFDDQGCMFDAHGNVANWQTDAERTAFKKRAQVVIDHADRFEVLPGLCMKGELVIGESIADLGGIEIAYDALRYALQGKLTELALGKSGRSPAQLFFINYATTERGRTREERIRESTLTDPHPNERFRVNGMLSHVSAFYDAFEVTEGDALYRAPNDRAKIW